MESHAHASLALVINSNMNIWNKCVNQAKLQVVVSHWLPSRYAHSWVHYGSVKSPCAHGAARGLLISHNIGVGRFIKVMVREGLCVVFAVMGISPFELKEFHPACSAPIDLSSSKNSLTAKQCLFIQLIFFFYFICNSFISVCMNDTRNSVVFWGEVCYSELFCIVNFKTCCFVFS